MSCVHYKFSSKLNYDTVTFDGLHITLSDLKRQIMGREKLKAADCDLQITNAQTKEGKILNQRNDKLIVTFGINKLANAAIDIIASLYLANQR